MASRSRAGRDAGIGRASCARRCFQAALSIGQPPRTAVAIRAGSGEALGEHTAPARAPGYDELLAWSRELDHERVWAVRTAGTVSGGLERFLRARGERVVRVPPKLMATSRKSARTYGKSGSIDALAVARAALADPDLPNAHDDAAAESSSCSATTAPT